MKAWAVLAALFLGALALRPQLVGVGPLLPEIDDDLGVSHAVAGLLGTIPVLCMGLFAPPAAYLSARVGTRAAIGLCLAVIAGFGLLRGVAPGAPLVLTLTLPIGMAMGLAGALIPVVVKERFAQRPAFASGVYTTGIHTGAALSSALAVPIAASWGGWRGALVAFSATTAVLCAGWFLLTPPTSGRRREAPPRLPWSRGVVWGLVALFALQSIVYYGLVSWMPDAFQERGWSEHSAGELLGVMSIAALPSGLLVPYLADRRGSRRQWLGLAAAALLISTIGIATLPDAGFVWAAFAGMGIGATFPLTLILPLDVAHSPGDAGAVVGLMLGAGYTIAATGPVLLGAVRDVTGSFATSLWALVAIAAALVITVAPLSPQRLRPPAHLDPEPLGAP